MDTRMGNGGKLLAVTAQDGGFWPSLASLAQDVEPCGRYGIKVWMISKITKILSQQTSLQPERYQVYHTASDYSCSTSLPANIKSCQMWSKHHAALWPACLPISVTSYYSDMTDSIWLFPNCFWSLSSYRPFIYTCICKLGEVFTNGIIYCSIHLILHNFSYSFRCCLPIYTLMTVNLSSVYSIYDCAWRMLSTYNPTAMKSG